MLNTLLWPEVSFAVAAALALVVTYDVSYVWPIHGRMSALTDRCAVLERSLGSVLD